MRCESRHLFFSLERLVNITGSLGTSLGRLGRLGTTLDSRLPLWEIFSGRGEYEGSVRIGLERAMSHAIFLIDIDKGIAVVELGRGTGFGVDRERVASSCSDLGVVFLQAGCEGVAEVIARWASRGFCASVWVADIALHAAGDDGNARSLDHGGSGEQSKS